MRNSKSNAYFPEGKFHTISSLNHDNYAHRNDNLNSKDTLKEFSQSDQSKTFQKKCNKSINKNSMKNQLKSYKLLKISQKRNMRKTFSKIILENNLNKHRYEQEIISKLLRRKKHSHISSIARNVILNKQLENAKNTKQNFQQESSNHSIHHEKTHTFGFHLLSNIFKEMSNDILSKDKSKHYNIVMNYLQILINNCKEY